MYYVNCKKRMEMCTFVQNINKDKNRMSIRYIKMGIL